MVEERQGKLAIEAAKEANVPFVVFTSVGSSDKNTKIPHFDSKFAIEDSLRASGIPHYIIRPVCFMENIDSEHAKVKQGQLTFIIKPDCSLAWVSVIDIGIVAVKAFSNPDEFKGKIVELVGDKFNGLEMAATFSKLRNNEKWSYSSAPLWLIGIFVPEIATMAKWFHSTGYQNIDVDACKAIHPGMLNFEEYCKLKGFDKKTFPSAGGCSIM